MWDKFISQFKIISNKTNKIKNKNGKITAAGELNYLLHKVPCTIVGEFFLIRIDQNHVSLLYKTKIVEI